MIALRPDRIDALPSQVERFTYDRSRVRAGIAHLSVGNFHRAHQAVYLDRLLSAGETAWGLVGVGLLDDERERAKARALQAQDGLYTLTECPPDGANSTRVIGSILEYRHAPDDHEAVLARLADPAIRIVTMTVTEGGYNTDAHGTFDLAAPAVAADLAPGATPRTSFGLITEALRRRRDSGAGPFTVLSCDNLRHNGHVAANAVLSFARARDAELAAWIEREVTFPACMVDRITPATLPADAERLNRASGVDDAAPVFAEDFIQWVVEDRFCAGRPALETVGVQFVDDVAPYEAVKIRMLNGSHCVLGYAAALLGHRLVHEAMGDREVSDLVDQFLARDAAPLITAPPGMETAPYAALLRRRYGNPAIGDQVLRLCGDAISKQPIYLQDTVRGVLDSGRDPSRVAFMLASFAEYLRGRDDAGATYTPFEPHLGEEDARLAASDDLVDALRMSPFRGWGLADRPAFVARYEQIRRGIRRDGTRPTLRAVLDAA